MRFVKATFARRYTYSNIFGGLALAIPLLVLFPGPNPSAQEDEVSTVVNVTELNTLSKASSEGESTETGTRLLWGDLHVHSNLSFDAFSFGNRTLSPADAFSFARGQAVRSSGGLLAKLQRPLDFLMVSDHAEYMGVMRELVSGNQQLLGAPFAERWQQYLKADDMAAIVREFSGSIERTLEHTNVIPPDFESSIWAEVNAAAETHNKPGEFTAFVGYEWTSMITGRNLHRNVILRDGPEITLHHQPFSSIDGNDPEMLWDHLQKYFLDTGGRAMAIPHNGNLSNGLMFADTRINGDRITTEYARKRQQWEPIYEVTQVKGDAESHPLLSPADSFADFENWDKTDIAMKPRDPATMASTLAHEYARPVLKNGLRIEQDIGTNPFQFGLIGSTDSHTSLATADSDNFYGKFLDSEPSIDRLTNKMGGALWVNRKLSASGYAAVWSKKNTREDIFDALQRREVYASTGPRIGIRFFGGWSYTEALLDDPDFAAKSYQTGVPMGGILPAPTESGAAPVFLIHASKDPAGANLDRIQIIKGWLAKDGSVKEMIYDVTGSGNRERDVASGRLPPLPSTVNLRNASYDNSQGGSTLAARWTDPRFNPSQSAFYYARVLQIKTPRWTSYDAVRYGTELPPDVPAEIQERAYTSPIWYAPDN
jgi:hypothetical protein